MKRHPTGLGRSSRAALRVAANRMSTSGVAMSVRSFTARRRSLPRLWHRSHVVPSERSQENHS